MEFKVGDLIVGNGSNYYVFTNKYMICKVISVLNNTDIISVRIINSIYKDGLFYNNKGKIDNENYNDRVYDVDKSSFNLFKSKSTKSHLPTWW